MMIGAHRHLVTITHPAKPVEPPQWYCSIETAAAQVIDGVTAHLMRGRYHPGITIETQLQVAGRRFQVQSVADVDERHVELVLLCAEVVARGGTSAG